jgi:hypothetical protein
MKAELKSKWVEALRSGKYKQGRGLLKEGAQYCCLGVLCKIAGIQGKRRSYGVYEFNGKAVMPSADTCRALGLPVETAGDLGSRNDSGLSFSGIADYIEQNPEI